MISEKMVRALNDQINAELYSAYLYYAMEAYFQFNNLEGFANWMNVQTKEEMTHASKIYDFINDRSGRVELAEIEKPSVNWASPLAAFEASYKHEQFVTDRINKLVELANGEKDHATASFLKWFVDEQVEEESSVIKIVEKLKLVKDSAGSLLMIDHQLAKREFKA